VNYGLVTVTILNALTVVAFVMLPSCRSVYAQRSGERPAHDTVRELSRIDLNRAAELQILSPNKTNLVRQAIQKQISDDFRDLQALNNKMMADAWARPELDYKHISGMVGQISRKAARLRSNLGLPQSKEQREAKATVEIASPNDFRKELLLLDQSVMKFVTNPIFQKTNVVELDLANRASRDLNTVVDLSNTLKKVGEKLSKTVKAKAQRAKS
jgi:hypothetical protein